MFAQYIATRPILDLCELSVCSLGDWVSWRWWYQEIIDLDGTRERAAAELDGEDDKCGEGVMQEDTTSRRLKQVLL